MNSYDGQMTQEYFTQLWIQIIKHLALSQDTKKMFSFLNKCNIISIDEEWRKIIIWVPNDFVLIQAKKFFREGLGESIRECYNDQYSLEIVADTSISWVDLKEVFDKKVEKSGEKLKKMEEVSNVVEKVYKQHKAFFTEQFGVLFDTKFQFDNFVVGSYNEFPYVILQAICKEPGMAHNPFFLHGNVGLGKTHLLQATGNQIITSFPEKTVVYLPTSKLVTEIIDGIKNGTINKLLRKFDDVDVLILDDIQIIANKNACQDILLGLFNDFVSKKKQVIFSGDKPPRQLMNIEDRLKTRFALGTISEISQPDYETRLAILEKKWEIRWEVLSRNGLELIAQTITDNVRELEGITNTLITKKQMLGRELTIDDVIQILKSMGFEYRGQVAAVGTHINASDVVWKIPKKKSKDDEFTIMVQNIADYYGLTMEDMLADSRKKELVQARSVAMRLAKKSYWWTLEKIGSYFKKNHSSVIYALSNFEDNLKEDASLQDDLRALGIGI